MGGRYVDTTVDKVRVTETFRFYEINLRFVFYSAERNTFEKVVPLFSHVVGASTTVITHW
jgi:hypothetical protein